LRTCSAVIIAGENSSAGGDGDDDDDGADTTLPAGLRRGGAVGAVGTEAPHLWWLAVRIAPRAPAAADAAA
jgi:hypothetical protein